MMEIPYTVYHIRFVGETPIVDGNLKVEAQSIDEAIMRARGMGGVKEILSINKEWRKP